MKLYDEDIRALLERHFHVEPKPKGLRKYFCWLLGHGPATRGFIGAPICSFCHASVQGNWMPPPIGSTITVKRPARYDSPNVN